MIRRMQVKLKFLSFPLTYVLSCHALNQHLSVFIDENVGFSSVGVNSTRSHWQQVAWACQHHFGGLSEGLRQHLIYNFNYHDNKVEDSD